MLELLTFDQLSLRGLDEALLFYYIQTHLDRSISEYLCQLSRRGIGLRPSMSISIFIDVFTISSKKTFCLSQKDTLHLLFSCRRLFHPSLHTQPPRDNQNQNSTN